MEFHQREKNLQNEINVLKNLLDQKNKDIYILEKKTQETLGKCNNSALKENNIQMEQLIQLEKTTQVIFFLIFICIHVKNKKESTRKSSKTVLSKYGFL